MGVFIVFVLLCVASMLAKIKLFLHSSISQIALSERFDQQRGDLRLPLPEVARMAHTEAALLKGGI